MSERTPSSCEWLGWWKEHHFPDSPSLFATLDPSWECPEKERVLRYLREAPEIAFMGNGSSCIIGGECACRLHLDRHIQSDGNFIWRDDIAHYVDRHHLPLPERFIQHMRCRDFRPPDDTDWPIEERKRFRAMIPEEKIEVWGKKFNDRKLVYSLKAWRLLVRRLKRWPQPRITRRDAIEIALRRFTELGSPETGRLVATTVMVEPDRYRLFLCRRLIYDRDYSVEVDHQTGQILNISSPATFNTPIARYEIARALINLRCYKAARLFAGVFAPPITIEKAILLAKEALACDGQHVGESRVECQDYWEYYYIRFVPLAASGTGQPLRKPTIWVTVMAFTGDAGW